MPFILGLNTFGVRSQARDRLIVTQGSVTYVTSSLYASAGDTALECNGAFVGTIPWVDDATGGLFEPSTGALGWHVLYKTDQLNNAFTRLGPSRGTAEWVTIGQPATADLTLRIAGTVRATVANPLSINQWKRLHILVEGTSAGDEVRVCADGDTATPLISYTLIGADATALAAVGKPNGTWVVVPQTTTLALHAAWDPADADAQPEERMINLRAAARVPTGAGVSQAWSGTFADIDERPADDADKITASAVNQISTFTIASVSEPGAIAAKVYARVTRSGTDAGANIRAVRDDGSPDNGPSSPAPGDGDVATFFQPLTVAQINASEWGVESLT